MTVPYHEETIKASALIGITILFENDLYELARFVDKIHRAQDEEEKRKSSGTHHKSRSTLLGLAHKYAYLTDVLSDRVKDAIKQTGLSLGLTFEDDSP